ISESINAILVKCPKHSANKSCESQLIINIHMNPSFDVGNLEKFWMLDEVYDPSKRSNIKIISPYLIVVSRGEPIVMYPLQFIKSIDQDETEQSFSEDAKLPTNKEDNEIENSLRLKRSQRPKASRGTLKNSKNVFGGKRHDMDAFHSHNPRQPDFSNLGLVRVMDKSLKNNSFDNFDIPTDFNYEPRPYGQHMQEHYNKPISHSTYFKGPYNFNKQKIVDQSRIMDDFIYDQSSHLGDKGKYCPEVNEDLNYKSNPNSFPNMEEEENEHVDYKSQLNRYSDSNEFPEEKENLNYKPLLKTYPNINDFPEEREYLKYNSPMRSSPNINEYPQEMEYGNNFNNDPSQSKSNNNFKLQPRMNKLPPMKIRNEIKIPNEMDTKFSQNGISKNVFLHGKENEKVEFRRPVNRLSLSNDFLPARGRFNFKDNPNRHSDINNYPQERESKKYNLNANANADSNEKYFYHQKENKENNVNANGNGNANANDIPPAKEGENENINMHEQETMNEIPQEEVPENNPERPPVNDYPLGQPDVGSLEAIAKHHFTENLESEFHSFLINHYYLPDQYHPYSVFVPNYKKNGFVNYPNNHNYRPYRRYKNKRMKRSSPQVHNSENQDDSRLAIDPLKGYNLERVLDNGEASCDTCGGKNKKKGGKPGSRYCAPLVTSRNRPEKIEEVNPKLDEESPCDTCGGKNKKPGGKTLPSGLESANNVGENSLPTDLGSEIHVENSQDAIPCERCKGLDKCNDGKLISQSCGCVGNPDVCDCDSSKSSRASANTDLNNAGYSVFNMNNPVPLLTTKLKIFRRRHNTWWRIIPVITLNSMDGIYANENLSVVFSSHVDILRMEKSLGFLNSKLVIPKLKDEQKHTDTVKEFLGNIGNSVFLDSSSKDISMREIKSSMISNLKNKEKNEGLPIKSIDGLGNFPASMEALMKCPHKDNKLCLNVLDKKVPEFSLKVKIPFRENGLVQRNKYTVKIARIVTDATTKNALQIFIDVINKGFQAQIFSIYVCNCEQTFSSSTTPSVKKLLLPQIGQTVIFLLPLTRGFKKNSKFSCDVIVKATAHHNQKRDDFKTDIVAKRSLDIKVHSRCFCVWRCQCHCMGKLETFVDYNVCERMGHKSAEEAGLLYNCAPGNEKNDICIMDIQNAADEEDQCDTLCNIISIALFILLFLFLLGVWKAVLGFCFRSIGECGFSTVQPGRKYACTSKGRIFFVNVFFFILFPFSFWCKCFRPRLEDLMAASTEWSCHPQSDDDCENSCTKSDSDTHYRLHGGQDPQINERLMLAFAPLHENGLFKDEKPEDEESTAFILEVLEESKHSLSKMMSQTVENISKTETKCEESSDVEEADELIDSLKNAQVVYRTMSTPVGGVIDIPENCKYCVKGFFLPTINSTYEFISYHPLTQYWGITEENESRKLAQPRYIHTDGFSRTYNTKVEVFKAADLSVVCPIKVPCINIDELNYLENSFVKLSTQQELIKAHQS
ncbi:hypothetical protein KR009_007439, partial [Drosophila setifemur]